MWRRVNRKDVFVKNLHQHQSSLLPITIQAELKSTQIAI